MSATMKPEWSMHGEAYGKRWSKAWSQSWHSIITSLDASLVDLNQINNDILLNLIRYTYRLTVKRFDEKPPKMATDLTNAEVKLSPTMTLAQMRIELANAKKGK